MADLAVLAGLIKQRNATEIEIAAIIGRPASIGHLGEYIASKIFNITLARSATEKAIDGHFTDGPLAGRSVNIKWYAKHENMLDIAPAALPDYYLVLSGPKAAVASSRGAVRPWLIEQVYLFDAPQLVQALLPGGTLIGIATSVRQAFWTSAEIYPQPNNPLLTLSDEHRAALALFR